MDLFNEWHKLEKIKFSQQTKKEDIMEAIYQSSTSTIDNLKKRLLYKIYYIIGFIVLFVSLGIYHFDKTEYLLLISIWIATYGLCGILMYNRYKKMSNLNFSSSSLDYMKHNAAMIKGALKLEGLWGQIFFPIAIITGVLLSRVSSGYSIESILSEPKILVFMLGAIVLLTPVLKFAGDKMNDSAYGAYIKELESKISKMENL